MPAVTKLLRVVVPLVTILTFAGVLYYAFANPRTPEQERELNFMRSVLDDLEHPTEANAFLRDNVCSEVERHAKEWKAAGAGGGELGRLRAGCEAQRERGRAFFRGE